MKIALCLLMVTLGASGQATECRGKHDRFLTSGACPSGYRPYSYNGEAKLTKHKPQGSPDAAGLPLTPLMMNYEHVTGTTADYGGNPKSFDISKAGCPKDTTCHAIMIGTPGNQVTVDFDDKASMSSPSGRIDRLSDSEYTRLQSLRKAVIDAEKEIAKSHGVCDHDWEFCSTYSAYITRDRYEFRGQFLLVNVPKGE